MELVLAKCGVWWLEYEFLFSLVRVFGLLFFIGRVGAGLPFRVFGAGFRISISSLWGEFGTSVVVL